MDFEKMLQDIACDCGMVHSCSIRKILIGSGVLKQLQEEVKEYRNILLVADSNTYAVCGEETKEQLNGRLEKVLVYQREGLLVPNEEAVAELEALLTPDTDLILGIGSGVIQDLCKYVSFQAKLPYGIIATAPSMDGYASKGAAMLMQNMKITYNAHVPQLIIGDVDILKDAPMEMIQSGYGDILGKYSCLNDWKLSTVVNGEFFCQYVYDLTYEMLLKTKELGPALQKRDPRAIEILMEALVGVGIAMAYVGNSRPASGSEHHLSHFFEVTGLVFDQPYFMHGTDVVYSAVATQKLREELLQMERPAANQIPSRSEWEAAIRKVYGKSAEGVIALQEKLGWYEQDRLAAYREHWQEIQTVLSEVPSSEELIGLVESVGLDIREFEKLYGRQKLQDAVWYAKDLKDRYTVLWMYYDLMKGCEEK